MLRLILKCLFSFIFFTFLFEIGARLFLQEELKLWFVIDERNTLFRYDAELGWAPTGHKHERMESDPSFMVQTNSEGFRDCEHNDNDERKRLVVLGDSFVWGYSVDNDQIFTSLLQRKDPTVDVFNLGVSGYGTDQEFLLLKQRFDRYRPDVVLLLFNPDNDHADNSMNQSYGGYYKPYFRVQHDQSLEVYGTPPPTSVRTYFQSWRTLFKYSMVFRALAGLIVRWDMLNTVHVPDPTLALLGAMKNFLDEKEVKFYLGMIAPDSMITSFSKAANVSILDLSTSLRYKSDGMHWTPEGHQWVSDVIYGKYPEIF